MSTHLIIYNFGISYIGNDDKQHYTEIKSHSAPAVREFFISSYPGRKILNVTNLTLQSNANKVAQMVVMYVRDNKINNSKYEGIIVKGIAALSTTILTQFSHHLEGDNFDNIKNIGKHFYELVTNRVK